MCLPDTPCFRFELFYRSDVVHAVTIYVDYTCPFGHVWALESVLFAGDVDVFGTFSFNLDGLVPKEGGHRHGPLGVGALARSTLHEYHDANDSTRFDGYIFVLNLFERYPQSITWFQFHGLG